MQEPYEIAYLVDRFMRRIASNVHSKATEIDTERVGPIGGMILLTLSDIQPVPIHQLVDHMGRDKSQMTRAIKSLETKGMIERRASPTDGRSSQVQLAPRGEAFVMDIKKILSLVIDDILAPVSPAQKQNLIETLRLI